MFNLKNSKFLKIGQVIVVFLLTVVLVSAVNVAIAQFGDTSGPGGTGTNGSTNGDSSFLRLDARTVALFVKPLGGNKAAYKVNNRSAKDFFVPLKTPAEWNSFRYNTPSNVDVTLDPPFTACVPLQKECVTDQMCTEYSRGYNASNCTYSPVSDSFEPKNCCTASRNNGCFFTPLSAGCQVNALTQACGLTSATLNGGSTPGSWSYINTREHCRLATNLDTCLDHANYKNHCSYSIPSVSCTVNGVTKLIDPDVEVCCDFTGGQYIACAHAGICGSPKNEPDCRN